MDSACRQNGKNRGTLKIVIGRYIGKELLGNPRCKLEDNIGIDVKKIVNMRNWID